MPYYTTGRATATAGTEITSICPPQGTMVPVCRGLSYTAAGTAHNAYVTPCRGVTTTVGFTDAGDTTIELAKIDPGRTTAGEYEQLAVSDFVAYQTRYGNVEIREISSVSGSTITIAATTDIVDDGAKVWAFYAPGDVGSVRIPCAANTEVTFDNLFVQGGIPTQDGIEMKVSGVAMPLAVIVDNATAAGVLNWVSYEWIDGSNDF